MEILNLPIEAVIPYQRNPRRNDAAVKPVAESIKQFGFKVPLVIDKDNVVVCGHTRLRAAKRLKMTTVPCIRADDLSEEQIKAFREDNFDMDEALEAVKEPTSKPGMIYQLGKHRLMCGDSTSRADVEKLLAGQLVDMVFTDPPYNVAYVGGTKDKLTIQNDNMSDTEFNNFLDAVFANYFAAMKPGAPFYVCFATSQTTAFCRGVVDSGLLLKQHLVWCKDRFVLSRQDYNWQHEPILYGWKPGGPHKFYGTRKLSTVIPDDYPAEIGMDEQGRQMLYVHVGLKTVILRADNIEAVNIDEVSSIIHIPRPNQNKDHPTMKPIALCAHCIKNSSQQGEAVLDLFGGSGSTLIACEQINRRCYSMELDPVYCDVIVKRWEQLTGKKAGVLSG